MTDPTADYLVTVKEGDVIDLSELINQFGTREFALLCITDPLPFATSPFEIGSVGLRDNNYRTHVNTNGFNPLGRDYNSEGSPPYVLADDESGIYQPTNFVQFGGTDWSVTCQAFCERGLQGEESVAVTRTFQVVPPERNIR